MKHTSFNARTLVLLVGLLASVGCGISAANLMATAVPPTLTAIAATQKLALMSFHGRYVTAKGGGSDWVLRQEPELSECGWFTPHHHANGKIALVTCYGKYVTAPKTGATRSDWMLRQETEPDGCGEFVLHNLGRDGFALETCAGNFLTAGAEGPGWEGKLAWSIVGETDTIKEWERFRLLEPYIPPLSVITNFDSCGEPTKRGREMGTAYDPKSGDTIVGSYVQEAERGCISRLEYDMVFWSGFWIRLGEADLSPYSQLVFDIKGDSQENAPGRIKIELKRAGEQEVSILYTSGVTTDWQTMRVSLGDFAGSLSSFTDIEELVFVFEANGSRKTGVIYLDNIALQRAWGNQ
jgi:hypothetical protein